MLVIDHTLSPYPPPTTTTPPNSQSAPDPLPRPHTLFQATSALPLRHQHTLLTHPLPCNTNALSSRPRCHTLSQVTSDPPPHPTHPLPRNRHPLPHHRHLSLTSGHPLPGCPKSDLYQLFSVNMTRTFLLP